MAKSASIFTTQSWGRNQTPASTKTTFTTQSWGRNQKPASTKITDIFTFRSQCWRKV